MKAKRTKGWLNLDAPFRRIIFSVISEGWDEWGNRKLRAEGKEEDLCFGSNKKGVKIKGA